MYDACGAMRSYIGTCIFCSANAITYERFVILIYLYWAVWCACFTLIFIINESQTVLWVCAVTYICVYALYIICIRVFHFKIISFCFINHFPFLKQNEQEKKYNERRRHDGRIVFVQSVCIIIRVSQICIYLPLVHNFFYTLVQLLEFKLELSVETIVIIVAEV